MTFEEILSLVENLLKAMDNPRFKGTLGTITLLVAIIMTRLQRSKIKVNVWSWIARHIGNAINRDVMDQMKSLNEKVDRVSKRQDEQDADRDLQRTKDARRRILRTADEISNGIEHSEEYFNDMWEDVDLYERYVKKHPGFVNGKAKEAIALCTETYHEVKKKNKFK